MHFIEKKCISTEIYNISPTRILSMEMYKKNFKKLFVRINIRYDGLFRR